MITKKNILITGSRAPVALDLARQLKANGFRVYCADSISHPLSRFSNSCAKSYKVASPRHNTNQYIADLIRICNTHQIDMIIPTCEEAFYLSKHRAKFPVGVDVFIADFDIMKTLHSKWDFINLVQSKGLKAPQSWLIKNSEDLEKVPMATFILKPVFSRFGSSVHKVENRAYPNISISEDKPWIAQEYLPGKVWCSYSVVRNGKMLLHANYSSEFKVNNGASIHFQHEKIAAIEEWIEHFVSSIDFTGQIAFDFIQSEEGDFLPIECNPRATSGIHLVRHLSAFTEMLVNGGGLLQQPPNGTQATLKLPMYIYGLSSIGSISNLSKWRKAMKANDVIFQKNDPLPAFHQLVTFLEFWVRGIRLGISPVQASTYDIEYNGG